MKKTSLVGLFVLVNIFRAAGDDFTVTSSADDGSPGTLRDVILNQARNDDRVLFDSAVTSITLAQGEIAISNAIEVVGSVTISAANASRIFYVYAGTGHDVVLEGLTLTNGKTAADDPDIKTPGGGGAVYVERCRNFTMQDCTVADSQAATGGAIRSDRITNLINCTIKDNSSSGDGGGYYSNAGPTMPLTVTGGIFSGNQSGVLGGALRVGAWNSSNVMVDSTIFTNNASVSSGGAVYTSGNQSGAIEIRNALFADNQSTESNGGGLCISGGEVTVAHTRFLRNIALTGSGAVAIAGAAKLENCLFEENEATQSLAATFAGGAIGIRSGRDTEILRCVFRNNTLVGQNGGAINVYDGNSITYVRDCLFEGNQGPSGGAIGITRQTEVYGSTFINNTATSGGGAIYINGPVNENIIANCTFSGNEAGTSGGAIHAGTRYRGSGVPNYQPRFRLYNSTFVGNKSASGGGAIRVARTATELRHGSIYSSLFHNNTHNENQSDILGELVNVEHCLFNVSDANGPDIEGSAAGTIYNVSDPKIASLADNGSPELVGDYKLLTFATLRGSPARNAGTNLLELEFDQRGPGFPREFPEGQPDIGAYEFSPSIVHTLLLMY